MLSHSSFVGSVEPGQDRLPRDGPEPNHRDAARREVEKLETEFDRFTNVQTFFGFPVNRLQQTQSNEEEKS